LKVIAPHFNFEFQVGGISAKPPLHMDCRRDQGRFSVYSQPLEREARNSQFCNYSCERILGKIFLGEDNFSEGTIQEIAMGASLSRRSSLFAMAGLAIAQESPADLERVKVGAMPPIFELPSADGGKVSLNSLQGKDVVLVFYRGYW
jgi:hypothetical protein